MLRIEVPGTEAQPLLSELMVVQVAAERHNSELRQVCIDIATCCLPDVLVSYMTLCVVSLKHNQDQQGLSWGDVNAIASQKTPAHSHYSAAFICTKLILQQYGIVCGSPSRFDLIYSAAM